MTFLCVFGACRASLVAPPRVVGSLRRLSGGGFVGGCGGSGAAAAAAEAPPPHRRAVATRLIDGKACAASLRAEVAASVASAVVQHGRAPRLGVVLVGDRPDSAR